MGPLEVLNLAVEAVLWHRGVPVGVACDAISKSHDELEEAVPDWGVNC